MNQLVAFTDRAPALVAAGGARASYHFFEFFTVKIRNPDTRRAYARAVQQLLAWCEQRHVDRRGAAAVCRYMKNISKLCQFCSRYAPTAKKTIFLGHSTLCTPPCVSIHVRFSAPIGPNCFT
jgi:hypothetical protein